MRQPQIKARSIEMRMPKYMMVMTFLIMLLLSASARAGDDTPAWLKQTATISVPTYGKNVSAVVLLNEKRVTVDDDGHILTIERGAIRILNKEGRQEASTDIYYLPETGKVREMHAWLLRGSGEVKKYGKDQVIDASIDLNGVFDEGRFKRLSAKEDADVGSIFGYEWISEDRPIFAQDEWHFQYRLPTLASRFALTLPAGWQTEGVTFNHDKIEPVISGNTYTWELKELPFIDDEPASPPVTFIAPRLAISYFPPVGNAHAGNIKSFKSWPEVSRWLSQLSDPQTNLNDQLTTKAQSLVAGSKTEYERIRAIGQYVQKVQYISIQTGLGRGGGYRPHTAVDVFTKSYGDCKDKANLMRAMLKAVGIQAYLVTIYSGDSTYVRQEWPSPQQFNHCIIAIKVADNTPNATTLKYPGLGTLLIFDPTDESTPMGDLPESEQNSLALIVAGENGSLVKMPATLPEVNKLECNTDLTLNADGSIIGSVHESALGQPAVLARRQYRHLSQADYAKMIEKWVTVGVNSAKVAKIEPQDSDQAQFTLDVEFSADHYGQLMQNRLLVFKPAIVSRRESLLLTESSRKHPVVLSIQTYNETAKIKLPASFVVDELPDPVKIETTFGSYVTNYEVKDGYLFFSRALHVTQAIIPAEQYTTVRNFFEKIRNAEQAPVVLAKK